MAKWLLRCSFVLAALVLPVLLGAPAALAMWLLMPVAVECSHQLDERMCCGCGIATLVGVTCYTMPKDVFAFALVWGACGMGLLFAQPKDAFKRSLVWTGLCAGMLCLALWELGRCFPQGIFLGLAEHLTEWIDSRPDATDILLRCYQMGYARLEEGVSPAVSLFGLVLMPANVHTELLNSLRYTLEITLEALIPQAIGGWLVLTLVLVTALPDVIRRKQGKSGVLPTFGEWCITPWAGRNLNAMAIVYLLTLLAGNPVMITVGSMAASVFEWGYIIFGMAVMEGLGKRMGAARLMRRMWMAASLVFAPFVLILLGMADRMLDLRKLRRSTDKEGGYEQ